MPLFDSHCHLTDKKFDVDREDIINEAENNGLFREDIINEAENNGLFMITVGPSYKESIDAIALANKYPKNIWATVGIHPEYATEVSENISDELESLVHDKKVVAVGEGGLDYSNLKSKVQSLKSEQTNNFQFSNNLHPPAGGPIFKKETDIIEKQKKLFKIQLDLALKYDLPIIIHLRNKNREGNGFDAYKDALVMLDNLPKMPKGVVHFFQGNSIIAKEFARRGFYLGFDGYITFDSHYDEIIKEIPLDRILIETDSPYVAPVPFRGKRNEPKFVEYVAGKVAVVKGVSTEEIKRATHDNARALFRI
ncbi:MAG: TatD family hydrolase [Candidatus Parcubacteria bacterium]|nr:TatD family hydrolase [Candidatus Parcubacteria bacterium]